MTGENYEQDLFGVRFEAVYGPTADALTNKILEQHGIQDSEIMRAVVRSSVAQGMEFVDALWGDAAFGNVPRRSYDFYDQDGEAETAGVVVDISNARDKRRFDQDKGPRR